MPKQSTKTTKTNTKSSKSQKAITKTTKTTNTPEQPKKKTGSPSQYANKVKPLLRDIFAWVLLKVKSANFTA